MTAMKNFGGEFNVTKCKRPEAEHNLMYSLWNNDHHKNFIPYTVRVDDHEDAAEEFQRLLDTEDVRWIKAFRSDNEFYTCLRWTEPEELAKQRDTKAERALLEMVERNNAEIDRAVEERSHWADSDHFVCHVIIGTLVAAIVGMFAMMAFA